MRDWIKQPLTNEEYILGLEEKVEKIREIVDKHYSEIDKKKPPDKLDILLGINPNDPLQRYANLLALLRSILE